MQSFLKFRLKFPYKLICGWVADRGVCYVYSIQRGLYDALLSSDNIGGSVLSVSLFQLKLI